MPRVTCEYDPLRRVAQYILVRPCKVLLVNELAGVFDQYGVNVSVVTASECFGQFLRCGRVEAGLGKRPDLPAVIGSSRGFENNLLRFLKDREASPGVASCLDSVVIRDVNGDSPPDLFSLGPVGPRDRTLLVVTRDGELVLDLPTDQVWIRPF